MEKWKSKLLALDLVKILDIKAPSTHDWLLPNFLALMVYSTTSTST